MIENNFVIFVIFLYEIKLKKKTEQCDSMVFHYFYWKKDQMTNFYLYNLNFFFAMKIYQCVPKMNQLKTQ